MGFGLLFVGYALTFVMSFAPYNYIFRFAGWLLISWGGLRLYEYNRKFIYPLAASWGMILLSLLDLVREGGGKLEVSLPGWIEASKNVSAGIRIFGELFFNIALLVVVAFFAARLELKKQRNMAIRNAVFVGIWGILQLLGIFIDTASHPIFAYFALPTFLIWLAWIILNLILIFSCYMYIAPEGDEDMPRRKTNIKFIDQLLEESDRRFEKAAQETTEYYKNKMNDKQQKKKKKKK